MTVEEAYANLEQAITDYIHSIHGDDKFVPHWIVTAGVHDMNRPGATSVHTVTEETAPEYVLSGLMMWAQEQFAPSITYDDEDEDE